MLGAVPTMLLFLVTLAAYRFLVHTPLTKVLQERYSKTQGAIENAAAAVAAAERKQPNMKSGCGLPGPKFCAICMSIWRRFAWSRRSLLPQARAAAQEKTVAAMAPIEDSMQVARMELDGLVGELSAEILKRILPAGAASSQEQAG